MSAVQSSRFRLLRAHPIFPILVFVVFSVIVKDNYPFTHYSMYSRPTSRPLSYYFLADGEGEPLPILYHTGLTPSRLTKQFGYHKGKLEKDESLTAEEIEREAADEVLAYIRSMNSQRKNRLLPEGIQLVKMKISIDRDGFKETPTYFAETNSQ